MYTATWTSCDTAPPLAVVVRVLPNAQANHRAGVMRVLQEEPDLSRDMLRGVLAVGDRHRGLVISPGTRAARCDGVGYGYDYGSRKYKVCHRRRAAPPASSSSP